MTSPAPLSTGQIEELKALLEKAADERWAVNPDDRSGMSYNNEIVLADDTAQRPHRWPGMRVAFMAHAGPENQDEFDAKAALTVALRNAAPALLSEVEKSRAVIGELMEALRGMTSDLLSKCDPSNWDAEGHKGLEYSIRQEIYEDLHEFASDWQSRVSALSRTCQYIIKQGNSEAMIVPKDAGEVSVNMQRKPK